MSWRLQKLHELEARLDEALHEFYYPNSAAVNAAMKKASPQMGRAQWKKTFSKERERMPKPKEWLVGPAVRTFKGPVLVAPAYHKEARRPGQYRNHLIPLLEIKKRGLGTPEGHATVARTMGFKTSRQPFVSRGEAKQLAKKTGRLLDDPQAPWRKTAWKGLHSTDVRWE